MTRLFGTDGIRGPAGEPPLDAETVGRLGAALAATLAAEAPRPRVVLGGDTRESTPRIAAWLAGGLAAGGAEVVSAGTLPTPGIAWLTRELGAAAGAVISASHNPFADNGIKLIDGDGGKWTHDAEHRLERRLDATPPPAAGEVPPAADPALAGRYLDALAAQLPDGRPLAGLRLLADTANGAASGLAARLFERLGAGVDTLGDRPDGRNINRGCGSTDPAAMARATAGAGADLGLAFDGDADRVIFADERGEVRDGDALLYLWARELAARGALEPRRIVATTMSNLGLERALAGEGIGVERCPVGDRAVVDTLRAEGLTLGGEQSGHVVHLGLGPTGDGLQTALHLAALVRRSGRPVSELLAAFRRYPQLLVNVPVACKPDLLALPRVAAAARDVEARLGERGRLVLRYSGTEPLARVMLEGESAEEIAALAASLVEAIRAEVGA